MPRNLHIEKVDNGYILSYEDNMYMSHRRIALELTDVYAFIEKHFNTVTIPVTPTSPTSGT